MGTVKTGKIKSVLKSQKKAVSASPTITPSHMLRANALMFVIWGGGGERHKRTNSGSRGNGSTVKLSSKRPIVSVLVIYLLLFNMRFIFTAFITATTAFL